MSTQHNIKSTLVGRETSTDNAVSRCDNNDHIRLLALTVDGGYISLRTLYSHLLRKVSAASTIAEYGAIMRILAGLTCLVLTKSVRKLNTALIRSQFLLDCTYSPGTDVKLPSHRLGHVLEEFIQAKFP